MSAIWSSQTPSFLASGAYDQRVRTTSPFDRQTAMARHGDVHPRLHEGMDTSVAATGQLARQEC